VGSEIEDEGGKQSAEYALLSYEVPLAALPLVHGKPQV
jgi:hypothetical protein